MQLSSNQLIGSGVAHAIEQHAEATQTDQYNPVTYADLTPEHQKKWNDTFRMMIYKFPGFTHMWTNMLNGEKLSPPSMHVPVFTRDVPIAATDGTSLLLNPDAFFDPCVGLMQRVYVVCHEILHNARGDVEFLQKCVQHGYVPMNDGTRVPFHNDTMQKAMDALINSALDDGRMGKRLDMFRGQPVGHFDDKVKPTDSFLDVYKRYYEEREGGEGGQEGDQPGGDQGGTGNNPGGFDQIKPPGSATGKEHHRDEGQWKVAMQQAADVEKSARHGRMPAGLERLFKMLMETEVPWVDHIETLIMRNVGDGSFNWREPDPWLGSTESGDYFSPRVSGEGAGWIAIWGDTSGSRNQEEIASNVRELAGIMEAVSPERLTVAWGDAKIHNVEEITEATDLKKLQPKGGGGTDMDPFLEWVKEQYPEEPDLIIAFTDGILDFPKEPRYPVIWAMSRDVKAPYGQHVRVCKSKRGAFK